MPYTSLLLQVSSVVNELGLEARGSSDATERPSLARQGRSVTSAQTMQCNADGGAGRDRTGDPLVANQVLSQLSYSPEVWWA